MKIILVSLVGMALGYFLAKRGDLGFKNNDVSEAKELKEERKRKILAMFDSKESITRRCPNGTWHFRPQCHKIPR